MMVEIGSRTREINESVKIWKNYHKYKNDMKTMAFAMGPGDDVIS